MSHILLRLVMLLIVCFAIGMVNATSRASSLQGLMRESLRGFVSLAGGFVLLVVCIELVLSVAQAQG